MNELRCLTFVRDAVFTNRSRSQTLERRVLEENNVVSVECQNVGGGISFPVRLVEMRPSVQQQFHYLQTVKQINKELKNLSRGNRRNNNTDFYVTIQFRRFQLSTLNKNYERGPKVCNRNSAVVGGFSSTYSCHCVE